MRWLVLLLLGGCLEYEVNVDTVVTAEGKVERSVAIRETSEKDPEAWARYAPARGPYRLSGNEKDGFTAKAIFEAGLLPSGLRVLLEEVEGDYAGAKGTEGKRTAEGEVLVTVQDVVFGRIYRYEETIDLGIDPVYFRKEFDFALDLALRIEIAAMEILEPELDFEPVRAHARKVVLPQISRVLLAIHTHLAWLAADGLTLDEKILDPEHLDRDPRVRVILAELRKLGLTREEGLHGELIDIITNGWRVDERVWLGWLEPLKGATRERRLDLRKRLLASFEHDDESKLQERALEKTVAPEERDAVQKRLMKLAYAGLGALTLHEFLDDHQIRLRVRLPGRVLLTDGHLHDLPKVEWRIETYQLVNPRVFACSFLPSDKMVGRIGDVQALFRFAQYMDPLDEKERAEVTQFLQAAKKDGLAKTNETFLKGGDRKFELLSRVLVEK